jgi:hypothetical protein
VHGRRYVSSGKGFLKWDGQRKARVPKVALAHYRQPRPRDIFRFDFDSIMCLLVGSLSEEEPWKPMLPLVRGLSARRIAQVRFNHANDMGKSFGTKTREWVLSLSSRMSRTTKTR